jgi:hypothetical protein
MKIRINFCDFWPGFETSNFFLKFLERHFDVQISEDPDYLFFSVYGNKHLNYGNCIKILYTGENLVPDFNLSDYAMGFHYLEFGDRYMRLPLHVYYRWYHSGIFDDRLNSTIPSALSEIAPEKRKFCNFVYSNNVNSDPSRDEFFHLLSKYKKVDSGGRHLNNIGQPVANKMQFIKDYKFTLAFENSSVPGYTTEKLLEPVIVRSIPVYYGNPLVHLDFNIGSIVRVTERNDFSRAIDEIIYLDKNDDVYLSRLSQLKFSPDNLLDEWEVKLLKFLNNIFNQEKESARRKPVFGYNRYYHEELKLQSDLLSKRRSANSFKNSVKKVIRRFSL